MTDDLDARVRRAMANVVEAAPPAPPFELLLERDTRLAGGSGGRRRLTAVAAAFFVVVGITGTAAVLGGDEDIPVTAGSAPGGDGCVPSDVGRSGVGVAESKGTGTGEAWALLFERPPWRVGQKVKVVWRMTGSGAFDVVAVGPGGERVAPSSGPTRHDESGWERPGGEWGTFFVLPSAGCWTLEASRGEDVSSVSLQVVESAAGR